MAMPADLEQTPQQLLRRLDILIDEIDAEATVRCSRWGAIQPHFRASALNLAAYLALRERDLRALQSALMPLGLSSLGRLESRVLPGLQAVRASLAAIAGEAGRARPTAAEFFEGEQRLQERTRDLLGPMDAAGPVAMLVTCPSEAADDPGFMQRLAEAGVDAIRINCAHDDAARWQHMIDHARAAPLPTGRRMRVFMDIAGPKVRTGEIRPKADGERLQRGDELVLVGPGSLGGVPDNPALPAVECLIDEPIAAAREGQRVFYDDGKFEARVERREAWGLVLRLVVCADKGVRLKPEKGLNFPDTDFEVDALTAKDLQDLDFIAAQADAIEYSFVQSVEDVDRLHEALAARRPDWQTLSLVLKIETARAVAQLPEILVRAARRQPTALMIARGDLALEIGFARAAEMQEEILWIAEAAHVPVIWATQVLEHLIQKGVPSRGEATDAAMAARAECVMLNKGPFVFEAIETLKVLLPRMNDHVHKKTPQLRRLHSWPAPADA